MKHRVIALDLGGTLVKAGLVDENGIMTSHEFASHSGESFAGLLQQIEEKIMLLLKSADCSLKDVAGIGVSIPGIVDVRQKRMLAVNEKFNNARNFDFGKWALQHFGLNLEIENDARCALLGERQYGAAKGYDDVVMVTLGTGVGGAALINGQLLHGKHFQAGCLGGHFVIDYRGTLCNCGNIGCVESIASTWRLPSLVREQPGFAGSLLKTRDIIDFKALFEAADQHDTLAQNILRQCFEVWAAGIINMIHAYDPEIVVIGGGIMKSGDKILPFIREHVDKHAWTPWGKVKIVPAQHGSWSSMLGAARLVF